MAKIRTGAVVGQIRGSISGNTFSANRYGAYIRNRSVPTVSQTGEAQAAKTRFGVISALWKTLTDAQRQAWRTWAQNNPVSDVFGSVSPLAGNAAFIALNTRLSKAGDANIVIPPTTGAPVGVTVDEAIVNLGTGDNGLTLSKDPLDAGIKAWVWACVLDSPAITYSRNLERLVLVTAAGAVSPVEINAELETRFGTLQEGQLIRGRVQTYDSASGLVSIPAPFSCLVTDVDA